MENPSVSIPSIPWAGPSRAATSWCGASIVVCDAATAAVRARRSTDQGKILGLAITSDGTTLASVGNDLRIWDLRLGELLRFSPRAGQPLAAVKFRPGTQLLAFGGQEGTIQL